MNKRSRSRSRSYNRKYNKKDTTNDIKYKSQYIPSGKKIEHKSQDNSLLPRVSKKFSGEIVPSSSSIIGETNLPKELTVQTTSTAPTVTTVPTVQPEPNVTTLTVNAVPPPPPPSPLPPPPPPQPTISSDFLSFESASNCTYNNYKMKICD